MSKVLLLDALGNTSGIGGDGGELGFQALVLILCQVI